jgi:hypothetical protein
MKFPILLAPFFILMTFCFGQAQNEYKNYDLLKPTSPRNTNYNKFVSKADFFSINESLKQALLAEKPEVFEQKIAIDGGILNTFVFTKVEILAPNFHIKTSDGQVIVPAKDDVLYYRGKQQGENEDNWVSLSISANQVKYLFALKEGNYEINKNPDGLYTGYYSHNQKMTVAQNSFDESDEKFQEVRKQVSGLRVGNCIDVYVACDYQSFQAFGNTLSTANWARDIFADVASVYALHNVTIFLSQVFVHNTPDPYATATNLSVFRNTFVNTVQNNYTGRIAHLFSVRPLGGGLSNGIGGLCNTYPTYPGPQSVSTNLTTSITPFPNYSYNTYVVAHEMGHVMGLRHTHACVWNGNYTQIDDCGNVFATQNNNTPEGISCFNSSSTILPATGGTIMSQCHQLTGTGVNLNHGFGPIAGALLFENFAFASCNTGTACSTNPPPHDLCTNAIKITVNNTCTNNNFTNQNATATAGPPAFTCGNPGAVIKDIWYKLTIPSSGNVTIETSQVSGGLTDVLIQVYSGTCGSLAAIACDDNNGAGNHALLNVTGRTAGEEIWVRLVDTNSDQEGTFNICAYDPSVPCHPDLAAMVAFYNATGGPSWTVKTGWQAGAAGTNCDVCNWYGVECNSSGRVNSITLSSNNINAANLPAGLVNIPFLQDLRLYNNNISGPIPAFLSSMTYLRTLDLGNNNISGTIPNTLASVNNMKNLYLDGNELTGPLPVNLSTLDLSLIYLNNNNLSGCFPQSYSIFCNAAFNFSGNPLLAPGVPFADLCSMGNGIDGDMDGFCRGGQDCDDENNTIYPGAPELCNLEDDNCNGFIDDVAIPVTNTWIGGSGNWNVAVNWSLGIIPQRCQNVILSGTNGTIITVVPADTAYARSITIQAGVTLSISTTARVSILHGVNMVNNGTVTNNGDLFIQNIISPTLFGIQNFGTINNGSQGYIFVERSGTRSLSNESGALIQNSGNIVLDRHYINGSSTGLVNSGQINNQGNFTIRNINGTDLRIVQGSLFTNQLNSTLSLE